MQKEKKGRKKEKAQPVAIGEANISGFKYKGSDHWINSVVCCKYGF